jgi:hypothetical protein
MRAAFLRLGSWSGGRFVAAVGLLVVLAAAGPADEGGWTVLIGPGKGLDVWKGPTKDWQVGGDAALDPKNARKLTAKSGKGVLVNSPKGRAHDLVSKQKLGDVEVHVEFLIGKGSNSGVKLEGLYEIQILDSYGKKKLTGADSGGIYPRAEQEPRYHHIDDGVPPRVNAAKPAGEWQTLDIIFQAPRFDAQGKKAANARFVKVVLNGQVVQENQEVKWPTGHIWSKAKELEIATGPLLLQGDHGPVAFRNVKVRPYAAEAK